MSIDMHAIQKVHIFALGDQHFKCHSIKPQKHQK